MQPKKACKWCGEYPARHYAYKCRQNHNTKKTIRQVSDKQAAYHDWLEQVARPSLIARDGNYCSCCRKPCPMGLKLDIEHTLGVGSHAKLKRDINNMTLMCRWPCHRLKTVGKTCQH